MGSQSRIQLNNIERGMKRERASQDGGRCVRVKGLGEITASEECKGASGSRTTGATVRCVRPPRSGHPDLHTWCERSACVWTPPPPQTLMHTQTEEGAEFQVRISAGLRRWEEVTA